jgi:hypothetical protein
MVCQSLEASAGIRQKFCQRPAVSLGSICWRCEFALRFPAGALTQSRLRQEDNWLTQ